VTVPLALLAAGFIALYFGAEWLVRGSVALGLRLGISPLIAGLTIVALGTSAPELVVSLMAARGGQTEIALGNVVGSNIFNIGMILGLTASIVPLRVQSQLVKLDIPILIGVTLLFLFFFRDYNIGNFEALILTTGAIGYLLLNVVNARAGKAPKLTEEFQEEIPAPFGPVCKDIGYTVAGLALLIFGSRCFVDGASGLARSFGVSETVIGLTAASLTAASRGHADIAVGNIVGSCIFNLLAILGVAGLFGGPLTSTGITQVDLWHMAGLSVLLVPFSLTRFTLSRWEVLVFLAIFLGYQIHLWPK